MGNSNFALTSCTLNNCIASYKGGGIATTPEDSGLIEDTTIENCAAGTSGGQASYINKNLFPDNDEDIITANDDGSMSITVGVNKTITFDSQGGSKVNPIQVGMGQVAMNAPENPVRDGYTFQGWYEEKECDIPFCFGLDFVTDDITLYAKWDKNPTANYSVEHYLQKDNKTGYTLKSTETLTGEVGAQTQAKSKRYEGYTAKTIQQKTIKKDGSTVVKIYYDKDSKKPPIKPDPTKKHKHHANHNQQTAHKNSAFVKTGDDNSIVLWAIGLCIVLLPLIRRRIKNKE